MYPSLIVLVMAKQQSVFETAPFVVCSENNATANEASQQSRISSALQFASPQGSVDRLSLQSQSLSASGDPGQFSKDSVLHIDFYPDAEKFV